MAAFAVQNAETLPPIGTIPLDATPPFVPDGAQAGCIGSASSGLLFRPAAPHGAAYHVPLDARGRVGGDLHDQMTHWVVVHHRAHQGRAARDQIRLARFESMWPRQWKVRRGADDVAEPMFNGYLFAQVPAGQSWAPIVRKCPAVLRVLTDSQGAALVVPPRAIETILAKLDGNLDGIHDNRPKITVAQGLRAGTSVKVLPGTLVGIDAELDAVTAKDSDTRVQVLLKIMGGERLVTLPRDRVVSVFPAAAPENTAG